MQLGCARNWNDPWFLREQPGERDLGRRGLLSLRDAAKQINHRLVRFSSLRREARDDVPEVILVKLRVFVDLAGQEAPSKRTVRDEPNAEFFESWQHLLFGAPPP